MLCVYGRSVGSNLAETQILLARTRTPRSLLVLANAPRALNIYRCRLNRILSGILLAKNGENG